MSEENLPEGHVTLFLGASQSIIIGPGSTVLVEEAEGEAFGAVVVRVVDCSAELTFTPVGKPRVVPLGMIACSLSDVSDNMDVSSIPEYQPTPNVAPYRSRRVKAHV